ncbi:FecR family protein [Duganella levis]|uniref:FecR family protein n=1 Tax=Duganella levis TaxID=2692169 RepID=UPI0019293B3A|nr:FecR family protein [Duganella levis]
MYTHFKSIWAGGLLAAFALLAPAAWAGQAGTVVFVAGDAKLAARPAVLDVAVQEGDELATGADGYIYIKTVDQGFLVLRPNSKARIVAYHIDNANPANTRVKLELLQGVARSISGVGVKQARQNFRFNTPVAAIGVRGTDFVVYTDQQTSRVTVVSGGVVVSGFSGACGPEGGGPCEGGASRELFAGQAGLMLQVQRGQNMPQLLRSPAMSPADQGTPARPDEPVGKVGGSGVTDVSLDAQKTTTVLNNSRALGQQTNPPPAVAPPVVVAPPPVVEQSPPPVVTPDPPVITPQPPVVVTPDPPVTTPVTPPVTPVTPPVTTPDRKEVVWGRYQDIAGGIADAAVQAKLDSGAYSAQNFVGVYQIARLKDTAYVAPREGTASFVLASSDAILQRTGADAVQAAVQDAHLDVNFSTKTFNTGLTVVGDGLRVPVTINGTVTKLGEMVNTTLSDSKIRGYLGGANAAEAAYIFQYKTLGVMVNGATTWGR